MNNAILYLLQSPLLLNLLRHVSCSVDREAHQQQVCRASLTIETGLDQQINVHNAVIYFRPALLS